MTDASSTAEILAGIIREHYDLDEVGLPQPVPAAHQRRHRKLIVQTSAGPFLVKTYKRDPHVLDALRFQHRLADHLLKHDLPVARIQPAKSGKRIVEVGNWAVELQEFVQGESMRVSTDTLTVAADALGRFHQVCRDLPRPKREARMWRFSELPRDKFALLFERAKQEEDTKALKEQCDQVALFARDATEALSWEARDEFEAGLIHGDWHSGNLLFHGKELVAILDLEFAGEGCFLEDLAYAVSNLCIRTTSDPKVLTDRTELLLARYQRSRTLSYAEEVALYYAVGIKHVATVCYQTEQLGAVAGHSPRKWMEILAGQCTWLGQCAYRARWRV
jgi:Ser/Thr protein kinase RdoA (MazF antagonist)